MIVSFRGGLSASALRVSNVTDPVVQQELALDADARRRAKQHEAARLLDELKAKSLPITRGHGLPDAASGRRGNGLRGEKETDPSSCGGGSVEAQ